MSKLGQTLLYTYTENDGCHADKVGQQRPAVVVRDWGGCGNVKVHTDFTNDFEGGTPGSDGTLWLTSRSYSEDVAPGCLSPIPADEPKKTRAAKAKTEPPPPPAEAQSEQLQGATEANPEQVQASATGQATDTQPVA